MFMIIHFALQKKLFLLRLAAWLCFTFAVVKQDSPPSVRRSLSTLTSPFLEGGGVFVRPRRKKKKQSLTFSTRRPSGKPTPPPKKRRGLWGWGSAPQQPRGRGGVLFCRKEETPARAYSMEKKLL